MAKKTLLSSDIMDTMNGLTKKAQELASKDRKFVEFKKPTTDYYKLDLIIRKTRQTTTRYTRKNGQVIIRPILMQCEDIEKNYRAYLDERAKVNGVTISEYIHNLLDEDMRKNGAN